MISDADREELERLRAENEALKKTTAAKAGLSLKVSEKGAVSVYGLGRFPVTLYREQWLRLIEFSPTVHEFMQENEDKLKKRE